MKTIEGQAEAVVVEKKSKFIANVFYVESEEDAKEILNNIKKKYYDARHNCFAYRIKEENGILQKQSDDGEPSGTAGAPILNILEKQELVNVLVIVTRYFGGILLGTGGLVKAYSEAAKEAIENAKQVEKEEGYLAEIILNYNDVREFEYFCAKNSVNICKKEYLENVKLEIEVSKENYEKNVEEYLKENFQNIPVKNKKKKYVEKCQNVT